MAEHHRGYVNLYAGGARGRVEQRRQLRARSHQKEMKEKGFEQCPKCKRHYKDITRNHYSDPKNRIRCL